MSGRGDSDALRLLVVMAKSVEDSARGERDAATDAEHLCELRAAMAARVGVLDVGPLAAVLVRILDGVLRVMRVECEHGGSDKGGASADRHADRDVLVL